MKEAPQRLVLIACLLLAVGAHSPAQRPAPQSPASAFEAAKKSPLTLYAFLAQMPKGADLHLHLSGAVYAETFLQEAAADRLCIDPATSTLVANTGISRGQPTCANGQVAATTAFTNQHLYDALVDAFSMRGFVPSAGISAHDQFFATFDRFNALGNGAHAAEWLDEVAARAATQNEQYLEVMMTPPFSHAATAANEIGWPAGAEKAVTPEQLSQLRDALLANGLRDDIAIDRKEFADAEAQQRSLESCSSATEKPSIGCDVQIRWIYQVLRGFSPQQVFAQTLLGFEVASADPTVVGINFVMPEDGYVSMRDYHLQMQMLQYLHSVYPKVHISLHAGELAPGLVPPDGLSFHIREAVELAHAERIGHGVDILYEKDPNALLKEMAAKHVMVEINLTSNDVILGIKQPNHPLPQYRAAHVPVALSTDDEGVSRIDLTHEYVRAALEYKLSYTDLKNMARTSLEHSFLPGESLWQQADAFTSMRPACATSTTAPSPACAAFLRTSEQATQQWELERRYRIFESNLR